MLKILKGRLKDFIKYGSGFGFGDGFGLGSYGYGYSCGSGNGSGYGSGSYENFLKDPKTWKDAGAEIYD